jgi:hypothetical protein
MKPKPLKIRRRGFALIVTLSLMILLTVIAVGLLSLSSISLRSATEGSDLSIARANARMALMLAIGELQKSAGQDTRVTAKADLVDATNPPILGVWQSWQGDDHETTGTFAGRPKPPAYGNHKQTKFVSWLNSVSQSENSPDMGDLPDTSASGGSVTLLGEKSVGTKDPALHQIHLVPSKIEVSKSFGSYAWWVGGENQKARLPKPYKPVSNDAAHWSINMKSNSVADTKPFRLDSLQKTPEDADKGVTLKQCDLIGDADAAPVSQEFYHDLSTSSVGLLTNVATGGWKKDLSLFTETPASLIGTNNLPFFRLKKGQDSMGSMPTSSNPTAAKSMLYPWASYRGGGSNQPIYQLGPVCSWDNLRDYALFYQRMNITGTGKGSLSNLPFTQIYGDSYTYIHKVRVLPVIARVQWVFSHSAGSPPAPAAGQPTPPAGNLEPRLLLTPVITMWNPYNVEITTTFPLRFTIGKPLPVALRYTVNGVGNGNFNSLLTGSSNYNSPVLATSAGSLNYKIAASFRLLPGETRVFSPDATSTGGPVPAESEVTLAVGYRNTGGHYFPLRRDGAPLPTPPVSMTAPGSSTIKAEAKFDTMYSDGSSGVGIYLDMKNANDNTILLAYRMVYTPSMATQIYKPLTGLAESPPLAQLLTHPSPFMVTIFGARTASRTLIAAKGFVQSSPLVNYTAMGGKDIAESTIGIHYDGTNHPVNSPFDFSFNAVAGAGDNLMPNADDKTGSGYIITGFTTADGLPRCVIDELPTRPLQSLAELQNWDLRFDNPIPPFGFNLIGNSDASPLLPAAAVYNARTGGDAKNLQYDDSYCANHLLFDDWFLSSIAKNPTTYGNIGGSVQTTYADFVSGKTPLGNRAYVAIGEDTSKAGSSSAGATDLYSKYVKNADSWKKIASRLEVEGMFNVNSTSVTAWRALLGHGRNQQVPFMNSTLGSWSVGLSGESDYPISRFSIAGDKEATTSDNAQYTGYRLLDASTLDDLATKIVEQVRLRGPFLSLSEFVNRQLSSGNLALAGAVQTALNSLGTSGSSSPYSSVLGSPARRGSADPAPPGTSEYKFADAASNMSYSTYGLPGWVRQADVLRPLAPILTVRDDTFTIRAYGDSRGSDGKIRTSAVCEAVVRRTRDFVDETESADITTAPTHTANSNFGRRFKLVSFRWLSAGEI